MNIKNRLIIMNFLQFFVWGSWLISLGGYMERGLHFEGGQIGAIFATMGIASIIMPGITGIIADKWFRKFCQRTSLGIVSIHIVGMEYQ